MKAKMKFSYEDLAACAKREVVQRRRVYLRLVDQGKMKPEKAAREIELMQAIGEYFEGLREPGLL